VLEGIRRAVHSHREAAHALRPLDENAPLAASHGTRYPIVQGPMTRVSDTAAFAADVAEGGALPFLALALMRGPEVKALLEDTKDKLKDRPWGAGILGFVPLELREEQLEAIRACRPPFALIAGGRPDQARALEREGIPTYLHVPSPGLLKLFLSNGAQRFVFEGRECGGHVGPRSSFVLWESMIEVLLEHLPADQGKAQGHHVLFAGGVHDSLSASMVAVMAAPLAERGVRIGVLLGTAYLFTDEAVASGAIVRGFQEEAIRCERTALLETGPGHSTRCVETAYVQTFQEERRRLIREGRSPEETWLALEELNLGRLRMASKGIARRGQASDGLLLPFTTLSEEEQRLQGMYMIGQVAALRSEVTTIEKLHHDVAVGGSQRLQACPEEDRWIADQEASPFAAKTSQPSDIAIIGMSCILPKAPHLQAYWRNILNKVNAITEIPADRWDWTRYYDPDPKAKDKVYSKWGGFLDDVPFDPMSYGMPPSSLSSIEPLHLLTLEAVRAALKDAGYLDRPFDRERVSVILGTGLGGDLGQLYGFRSFMPHFLGDSASEMLTRLDDRLPQWTEDSFAGILPNVAAGRVANRFDLGGVNYTVDAACASSLAAVFLAVKELEGRTSDMVVVGGADTLQSPFSFLCFSKTYALSRSGQCRTFDEKADGIVISEGIGILILKRLADAERDGDRIYAVIKGVGGASDGRDKGLTAPRPEGQVRALRRAYAKAGVSPSTIGLIEAHGTGTVVGDRTELQSLSRVFEEANAAPQSCAIGSVKSMIGHTKN
ncbi:MAG TPA: beta-ketoacyl synthase N-terminal-like domain-containing protein, partial [Candidatus Methylomirabilis sp.]|nr:beta-ketoacyl synthase N-terminal-like domain-containing protein [Candidatus Methylomirabilis sp.]